MSKVLTDKELLAIVQKIVNDGDDIICERDAYLRFCVDMAQVITAYCGGDVVMSSDERRSGDGLGVCVHIDWNDSVPGDGGVYSQYDTDVTLEDWRQETIDNDESPSVA